MYIREPKIIVSFGKKIKELRAEKNISQSELALKSGLSTSQVGRIERGRLNTGLSTVYVLAMALEVKPKELFDFEEDHESLTHVNKAIQKQKTVKKRTGKKKK